MDYKRKIRKAVTIEAFFFAALGLLAVYESGRRGESIRTGSFIEQEVEGENAIWESIEAEETITKGTTEGAVKKAGEESEEGTTGEAVKKDFIKWVDFAVDNEALRTAMAIDIETYQSENHISWTNLLAYESTKTGGKITAAQAQDLKQTAEKLKNGELSFEELEQNTKYYSYYREVYEAVLGGMLGEYEKEIQEIKKRK